MRNLHELDKHRVQFRGNHGGADCGAFMVPSSDDGVPLRIIAATGMGWDHVSVSRGDRAPTWSEMEQVKRAFFEDWEIAMQLHVPPSQHINCHPHCLHIWRPLDCTIPTPPQVLV
jgi:hypothetical protein